MAVDRGKPDGCVRVHGLPGEQVAAEVVDRPPGVNDADRPPRLDTRLEVGLVPVPERLAFGRALGLDAPLDRVVDDDPVEALAGPAAADAGRPESARLLARSPVRHAGSLRVDPPTRALVELADLARSLERGPPRVRCVRDALGGVRQQPPDDGVLDELRLAVPRRGRPERERRAVTGRLERIRERP